MEIATENLNTTIEHWATVDGYLNYQASWWGRVSNTKSGRILKPGTCTGGYLIVCLCKNSKIKGHKIHLLVAREWVSNLDGKRCVDHIDGNRLNNHKNNLRFASHTENSRNRKKTNKPTSSIYKGVSFHKPLQKWVAHIRPASKTQHLGYFANEREAAMAYNKAALEHFGNFAKINIFED